MTLHQISPESNHPWVPRGEGAGAGAVFESSLRRTNEVRIARNPWMAFLPIRLYNPSTRTSFRVDHSQPSPLYVVISYTWGRWMHRNTRDHDNFINGADWRAPANERFSRERLDQAVKTISNGSNAWVDVFCIPQNDSNPEKSTEIGKQSAIFRSADRAAVWLGTGGEQSLVDVCSWVPEVIYMVSPRVFDFIGDYEEAIRRLEVLASLTEALPWASSLWTLQEAALRPDASFYGFEGALLCHGVSGSPITIRHLRNTMKAIWNELSDEIEQQKQQNLPVEAGGVASKDDTLPQPDSKQEKLFPSREKYRTA